LSCDFTTVKITQLYNAGMPHQKCTGMWRFSAYEFDRKFVVNRKV